MGYNQWANYADVISDDEMNKKFPKEMKALNDWLKERNIDWGELAFEIYYKDGTIIDKSWKPLWKDLKEKFKKLTSYTLSMMQVGSEIDSDFFTGGEGIFTIEEDIYQLRPDTKDLTKHFPSVTGRIYWVEGG